MNEDDVIIAGAVLFFVVVATTCAGRVLMDRLPDPPDQVEARDAK